MSKHETKVAKPKGWAWGECSCKWRGRARQTVHWVRGKCTASAKREQNALAAAEKDIAKHLTKVGGIEP